MLINASLSFNFSLKLLSASSKFSTRPEIFLGCCCDGEKPAPQMNSLMKKPQGNCCSSELEQGKMDHKNPESVRDSVKRYYGETIKSKDDMKASCCSSSAKMHPLIKETLSIVPEEILNRYYGCGGCIPMGIKGLNIVDLGSGSGRDCYIASKLVGPEGKIFGVDMTDQQLAVANKYIEEYTAKLGYSQPNMKFIKGYIELLSDIPEFKKAENKIDIAISNCVVNLSPRKDRVLKGVYNILKTGGEFYFSDVYCDRRLPENIRNNEVLHGECIAGSMYTNDFISLCKHVGFNDPRIVSREEINLEPKMRAILGDAKFYSTTYRLFKLKTLEETNEDYGQYAVYMGNMEGNIGSYVLDKNNVFPAQKPVPVSGNTASILSESYLNKYFKVVGEKKNHYGAFLYNINNSCNCGTGCNCSTTSQFNPCSCGCSTPMKSCDCSSQMKPNCNCPPTCTCGCQQGKPCTCGCGCAGKMKSSCNCPPTCTCGCQQGKQCTCAGQMQQTCGCGCQQMNSPCSCGPNCKCGCQQGKPCTCGCNCSCGCQQLKSSCSCGCQQMKQTCNCGCQQMKQTCNCGCNCNCSTQMKSSCSCGPNCKCGCQQGKPCTCGCGCSQQKNSCSCGCGCGPNCRCGCQEGKPCKC